MNHAATPLVIRWLVWDTFRQSLASRIFWVMLFVSALAVLFCLSADTADLPRPPADEAAERLPASAVTISLGRASSIRAARLAAANPPNTTECTAPMRAHARTANTASGMFGM